MLFKSLKSFTGYALISFVVTITLVMIGAQFTPAQSPISGLANFQAATLAQHNKYRAMHRSPAMKNSASLAATAQAWAENLARTGNFQHSSRSQRNNAGENLYYFATTQSNIAPEQLAQQAVKSWYDEVANYDFNRPGFSMKTGHFTQVVWKASTQLGCGAARGTLQQNGRVFNAFYVACHYAPAGNFQGQFPANVLPRS